MQGADDANTLEAWKRPGGSGVRIASGIWAGDLLLALALLTAIGGGGSVLWVHVGLAGWAGGDTEQAMVRARVGVGCAMAASAVVATFCVQRRLWVTGTTQALAFVAAGAFFVADTGILDREDPTYRPASEHYQRYGPPCFSGSDPAACAAGGG